MLSTEELPTVVAWRESDNYNPATLFGPARPRTEGATEAAGSGEEKEHADESAGEEARDLGEVTPAPGAGTD